MKDPDGRDTLLRARRTGCVRPRNISCRSGRIEDPIEKDVMCER